MKDDFENSGFRLTNSVVLHRHGCGSLACPECRKRRAAILRDMLKTAIHNGFGKNGLYMVTFTFRHDFSAEESFEMSSKERSMSECMRILRKYDAGEWFSMSEFQGNGYLHYHVLLEFPFRLDFRKIKDASGNLVFVDERIGQLMSRLRSVWHWGAVNFLWVQYVGSASSYVTKYLCGGGEKHPVPSWVLCLPRFRFFSTSRGFWVRFGVRTRQEPEKKEKTESVSSRETSTLGDRVTKCGTFTDLFHYGKYVGTICASLVSLSMMIPHRISSVYEDNGFGVCIQRQVVSFDTASLLLSCNDEGCFNWKKELDRNDDNIRWLDNCERDFCSGVGFGLDWFGRNRLGELRKIEV